MILPPAHLNSAEVGGGEEGGGEGAERRQLWPKVARDADGAAQPICRVDLINWQHSIKI